MNKANSSLCDPWNMRNLDNILHNRPQKMIEDLDLVFLLTKSHLMLSIHYSHAIFEILCTSTLVPEWNQPQILLIQQFDCPGNECGAFNNTVPYRLICKSILPTQIETAMHRSCISRVSITKE